MGRIHPGLILSIAVFSGCLPSYEDIPVQGNTAMRINAEFRSKWNEPGKRYRYDYYHFKGMGSHTERGECIIGDTVACTYKSALDDGVSQTPGRISGLFDKMDSVLRLMDPDSIRNETPFSYAMIERKGDDSLSFPFGYEVHFNAERSYIDSLFFLPFGPYIRIISMTLD